MLDNEHLISGIIMQRLFRKDTAVLVVPLHHTEYPQYLHSWLHVRPHGKVKQVMATTFPFSRQ